MPHFIDDLNLDILIDRWNASSKKQIFSILSNEIESVSGFPNQLILDRMMDRERLSPSAIGNGVSLTHFKLHDLEKPVFAFARLPQALEFYASDLQKVDLICVMISPRRDGPVHLRRLSRVTRLFRDPAFCNRLRSADSKDALHAILLGHDLDLQVAA